MRNLSSLPNIGKVLDIELTKVGINTIEQLKEIGSKNAWLKIKENNQTACYNMLCSLEGAIREIRWYHLPYEVKKDLRDFFEENSK